MSICSPQLLSGTHICGPRVFHERNGVKDVWALVSERFPGVRLESEIQGWAFLEQFQEGLDAYAALPNPSPKDDRWAAACHFQLLNDLEAIELLYKASNRGEEGAQVYLAHVLPFVERGEESSQILSQVEYESLSTYDQILYYRVLSIAEETNSDLRGALRASEEAWRRVQGTPEYNVLAPSILAQLAILHGRIGRSQRALWFLERGMIATEGIEMLKVRVRRAALLVNLGRYREAETELESPALANAPAQFQAEIKSLLGTIAWARSNLAEATQHYIEAIEFAQEHQFSYEEFVSRLPLISFLGHNRDFAAAQEHLTRAQLLISDKSDRLIFRFREVLLNYWRGTYQPSHALQELDGLIIAFGEMGLLQEQAAVKLHRAELMRTQGIVGWERVLDELHALSVSLQNPALLAREWALLPELQKLAMHSHPRIAGRAPVVLRVYTLGDERMQLNNDPIHIPLRRGIEVLAYFLEHKAVSLRRILADVFADEKPSAAKSYFHQFRHQLREHLSQVEIEYDSDVRLYRLKSEIDILWDVSELRAGRIMGETGTFLPSSGSEWVYQLDQSLDAYRGE